MKGTISEATAECYDAKRQRTKIPEMPPLTCPSCGKWQNHDPLCPEMTLEAALKREARAVEREKWARERADHWLMECRKMHGKLAMLKAENNKLRAKLKP